MARNDAWRRYLDTGAAFVALSRGRAETIVKDLVKTGELQQERAQKAVDELLDRSRKNTDEIAKIVRRELQNQLSALGLATQEDIARLEAKIQTAARPPAAKKAPAKKAASGSAAAEKA
jgi:polyhydroxyalkanoate synthesis regulator phasin